jgi:hypothetical protein
MESARVTEIGVHGHGHDDRHPGHGRPKPPARGLGLALAVVLGFGVLEVLVGWLSGSLALTADGFHMLTDAAALARWANHKSVGMTVLMLAVIRLLWRLTHPAPALPAGPGRGHAACRGTAETGAAIAPVLPDNA